MRSWRMNDQKYEQRGNRGRGSFLNGPSPTLKRSSNFVRFVHRWRPIGQCMAPEPKVSNGMPMKNHSMPLRGSHARVWGGSGTISLPRATIWPKSHSNALYWSAGFTCFTNSAPIFRKQLDRKMKRATSFNSDQGTSCKMRQNTKYFETEWSRSKLQRVALCSWIWRASKYIHDCRHNNFCGR